MRTALTLILIFVTFAERAFAFTIAENGKAKCVVLPRTNATATEQNAVKELTNTLTQITGVSFEVIQRKPKFFERYILVGLVTNVPEEYIRIDVERSRIILLGGSPRATLYAVSRFLQNSCDVRWWTPWASHIPLRPTLVVKNISLREKPAFEYREAYWTPAFNAQWAVRNFCNGQSHRIPNELGGAVRYKGFVHTFYPLVSPTNFAAHPEWFSFTKGKRTTNYAQLCLTNPKLRDYTVERVKQWLRQSPEARIVSVSQNDWHGFCECDVCKAVDDREGSHAGTMIAFVNYIAEKIEREFPHVAVDTLAYQYTRKPPKTVKPRHNVIVRLCSIECNFREPFDHPSNASFGDDIRGWAKICDRLYVWDYTTDFAHYVQPHPNWFVLGPDLHFFATNHVRGVFSEGAYQSHGSEMSEMRAWVTARLMWNLQLDDRALIREFVQGYFGTNAAPHILKYFALLHDASRGHNLTCYSKTDAPFLAFKQLVEAERLWQAAECDTTDEELLTRIRLAHLPVRYVFLQRWSALKKECDDAKSEWPLGNSRKQVAEDFAAVARGIEGKPWTKVTRMNEGGLTLEQFLGRVMKD
jgi:hypothetical protein